MLAGKEMINPQRVDASGQQIDVPQLQCIIDLPPLPLFLDFSQTPSPVLFPD